VTSWSRRVLYPSYVESTTVGPCLLGVALAAMSGACQAAGPAAPHRTEAGHLPHESSPPIVVADARSTPAEPVRAAPKRTYADKKIACLVYARNPGAHGCEDIARNHAETILEDNGVTVLDKATVERMTDVNELLKDPTVVITTDFLAENREKYKVDAIAAVYLRATVSTGLANYFTATAQADLRIVDEKTANAAPTSSQAMGVPGSPPSDGLTESAALKNAVRRAVEDACRHAGLEVMDPTRPRSVRLTLRGPVQHPDGPAPRPAKRAAPSRDVRKACKLERSWKRSETISAEALDASANVAALAGYITDTDQRRRPARRFGSRVHLVDAKGLREFNVLWCHEVGHGGGGGREILDCMFLGNWRFLVAVTGRKLFLWDVERGENMWSQDIRPPRGSPLLGFLRRGNRGYVTLGAGTRASTVYIIERAR